MTAAREVLESEVPRVGHRHGASGSRWRRAALDPDAAREIAGALAAAERPLIVTSYLGRNPRRGRGARRALPSNSASA